MISSLLAPAPTEFHLPLMQPQAKCPMSFWANLCFSGRSKCRKICSFAPIPATSVSPIRMMNSPLNDLAAKPHRTAAPFPRPHFVDYALWFAKQTDISFTSEHVSELHYSSSGFSVITHECKQYQAKHVVIATGLQHYSYIPPVLSTLPPQLISHTFAHRDFKPYANKKIAVIGSGQSAWEAAALLHMAGSEVELLFRRDAVQYASEDNVESGQKLIDSAEQFYLQSDQLKAERRNTPRQSSVAPFLKPYVEGKVTMTCGAAIAHAEATIDGKVLLQLGNNETRLVDHVIAATGYQINLDQVPFLPPHVLQHIEREPNSNAKFPLLNAQFESSIPGLYFAAH